ncbi:CG14969 [Drosophila busckii]|uniref:CG14969 n=1 Tax=Drosophila busckii TaxID=30019 RepID=A0A0M4EXE8_DROBS|nr:osteopetrosis-associated transmembrane protein 1 [Drosophila busckii]ALC42962.1 CG14969 [Drosophila busckii]
MKYHRLIFFLPLWMTFFCDTSASNTCKKLLAELADAQMWFVSCNTNHAVPVEPVCERLCFGCKDKYTEMDNKYNNLLKVENCTQMYVDIDRLNIVLTTQNTLKGLWERAFCEDCFRGNNSETLSLMYANVNSCLDTPHRKDICAECSEDYTTMNNFYKNLDVQNNGKICFDMQDMMNRTRVRWSRDLKCCKREVKMTLFIICTIVLAVVPFLLFYGTAFVLTKRRERNHDMLNDREPGVDETTTESTAQLITAAVLSTPIEPQTVYNDKTEKIAKLIAVKTDTTDSIDDEERIVKPKTN